MFHVEPDTQRGKVVPEGKFINLCRDAGLGSALGAIIRMIAKVIDIRCAQLIEACQDCA